MRTLVLAMLVGALLFAKDSFGGPLKSVPVRDLELVPFATRSMQTEFEPNVRSTAILIGDGRTYLGLYVYDREGNCVAWDDVAAPRVLDDIAVEWHPSKRESYTIQVINFGRGMNNAKLVIR